MFARHILRSGNVLRNRLVTPVVINQLKLISKEVQFLPKYNARHFTSSMKLLSSDSFECVNIQDTEDFNTKVLNNATPVIVDFHAT